MIVDLWVWCVRGWYLQPEQKVIICQMFFVLIVCVLTVCVMIVCVMTVCVMKYERCCVRNPTCFECVVEVWVLNLKIDFWWGYEC